MYMYIISQGVHTVQYSTYILYRTNTYSQPEEENTDMIGRYVLRASRVHMKQKQTENQKKKKLYEVRANKHSTQL